MEQSNHEYICSYYGNEQVLRFWLSEFTELAAYIPETQFLPNEFKETKYDLIVLSSRDLQINTANSKKVLTISQYIELLLANSLIMPHKLRIDFSTLCQLNCRDCYMRLSNSGTMGKGYLSFENFKKLIDDNPYIREIETSNSGELFLNPDLVKIIKYAFEHNVILTAYNGVNFNSVTDEQLDALVRYRFGGLVLSIDGGSEEVYAKYRQNGSFSNVVDNIKKLIAIKERYNSSYPILRWQYIIMEDNEEDIPNAKRWAEKLGIRIEFKLTWNKSYQPKNVAFLQKETGLSSFTREDQSKPQPYFGYLKCIQLYLSPQINWDGRLLGCCNLYKEDYEINVFDVGLREALSSFRYIAAKKYMLFRENSENATFPCLLCNTNKKMLLANTNLSVINTMYGKDEAPDPIMYIPYS